MMIIIKSISVVYQFWLHTATINKLPKWFSAIFTTPAIHRIHHANNVPYLDKNHGGIFIFWDKLLGTYTKQTVNPNYGLTTPIKTNNPFYIAFHEWKNLYTDLKNQDRVKIFFIIYLMLPAGAMMAHLKQQNNYRKKQDRLGDNKNGNSKYP